jgi:hypothetical protein
MLYLTLALALILGACLLLAYLDLCRKLTTLRVRSAETSKRVRLRLLDLDETLREIGSTVNRMGDPVSLDEDALREWAFRASLSEIEAVTALLERASERLLSARSAIHDGACWIEVGEPADAA